MNPRWLPTLSRKKLITSRGYLLVHCPEYPKAEKDKGSRKRGYVLEHRLVMANHLGRVLRDDEDIHHINGDRTDNRIENLELTDRVRHNEYHKFDIELRRKWAQRSIVAYTRAKMKKRVTVECACGCGGTFVTPDDHGRVRRYIHGHNPKKGNRRNKQHDEPK